MTDNKAQCSCNKAPQLVFSCSGAADVGHISDMTAREISRQGVAKMFCLAGVGGRVSDILEATKAASSILAIDGCPLDCARNTLQEAGFRDFRHLRLSDLGMEKGKTPATDTNIDTAVRRAKAQLPK